MPEGVARWTVLAPEAPRPRNQDDLRGDSPAPRHPHLRSLSQGKSGRRRRAATLAGAVANGIVALGSACAGDFAMGRFSAPAARWAGAPLVLTLAFFVACSWPTRAFAPQAARSGIPQAAAAVRDENIGARLFDWRAGLAKIALSDLASLGGIPGGIFALRWPWARGSANG